MTTKTFDLSKKIKSQKIKFDKNAENYIIFENDAEGQIERKIINSKLSFVIHNVTGINYTYTKTVEKYDSLISANSYKVTTTKYKYNYPAGKWEQVGKEMVTTTDVKPVQVKDDNIYWIKYNMTATGESSATSSSYFATNSATAKDEFYGAHIISKYKDGRKTVSESIMATITVDNTDKLTSLLYTANGYNNLDLLAQQYSPMQKGNKFIGSALNEIAQSSSTNEDFDLKTGTDEIQYNFFEGKSGVGNDIVKLAKNEVLTLHMHSATDNESYTTPDYNAEIYVDTQYEKKGNDLVMKFTNKFGDSLGQTTVKNYFKIAQDNITIQYSGASTTVIDYEDSLKDLLEYTDGIGYLGDEEAEHAQKITGNFLDNDIQGGKGNDIIKAVAGDNFITAGAGDDKIYGGNGTDFFFIYDKDATGIKGDTIFNATADDRLYFMGYDNEHYTDIITDFSNNNFDFTKKGNNLVVLYNGYGSVYNPGDENSNEKVTFIDYFRTNTELFNVNDAENYSALTINQEAKGTVKGTNNNDKITLTGKSNVYTGNGNDTINFYYNKSNGETTNSYLVDKNVNVYINGDGEKTLSRNDSNKVGEGADAGDMGNKTVIFKTEGQDSDKLYLNLGVQEYTKKEGSDYERTDNGYIFSKSGNDLKIEGYYGLNEGYDPVSEQNYSSYGSYVLKDYFSTKYNYKGSIYLDFEKEDPTVPKELDLNNYMLYQEAKNNKPKTYYDTQYNDYIMGAKKNDKYYFTEGGSDKVYDVRGNDAYNVDSLSNSLTITDKAGTSDKLVIIDNSGYNLYFEVGVSDKKLSSVGKDLQIIQGSDKSKGVTITDFIAEYKSGDEKVSTGAGCIESVKIGGAGISVDVDKIAGSVASWLADKGYASSESVFTDYQDDINAMLNVYTTGQYPLT